MLEKLLFRTQNGIQDTIQSDTVIRNGYMHAEFTTALLDSIFNALRELIFMQLMPRACPVCGVHSQSVWCDSNIDSAKLDKFAFASRKEPELMRHCLVTCKACDLVYADPAPSVEFLHTEYEASGQPIAARKPPRAARTCRKYFTGDDPAKVKRWIIRLRRRGIHRRIAVVRL